MISLHTKDYLCHIVINNIKHEVRDMMFPLGDHIRDHATALALSLCTLNEKSPSNEGLFGYSPGDRIYVDELTKGIVPIGHPYDPPVSRRTIGQDTLPYLTSSGTTRGSTCEE